MKLIIVCIGLALSFILGIAYFRNERKYKKSIRNKSILVDEIKGIDLYERRLYAYACPLRSYVLTGVLLGEFSDEHYPWLLRYNSLTKEQQDRSI